MKTLATAILIAIPATPEALLPERPTPVARSSACGRVIRTMAIDRLNGLDFLTLKEKEDLFYGNAA